MGAAPSKGGSEEERGWVRRSVGVRGAWGVMHGGHYGLNGGIMGRSMLNGGSLSGGAFAGGHLQAPSDVRGCPDAQHLVSVIIPRLEKRRIIQ